MIIFVPGCGRAFVTEPRAFLCPGRRTRSGVPVRRNNIVWNLLWGMVASGGNDRLSTASQRMFGFVDVYRARVFTPFCWQWSLHVISLNGMEASRGREGPIKNVRHSYDCYAKLFV